MNLSLLNLFATTLENLPARAILRTLELESSMLKDDLLNGRPVPVPEANSVLTFCALISSLREGSPLDHIAYRIPPLHLTLYRRTIDRLIAADELPLGARNQFDVAVSGYSKPTAPSDDKVPSQPSEPVPLGT